MKQKIHGAKVKAWIDARSYVNLVKESRKEDVNFVKLKAQEKYTS